MSLFNSKREMRWVGCRSGKKRNICMENEHLGRCSLFKNGPFPASFSLFSSFLQTVNKCSIKVADDWIRTRVLWYHKRPLCQLRHNHFPLLSLSCKLWRHHRQRTVVTFGRLAVWPFGCLAVWLFGRLAHLMPKIWRIWSRKFGDSCGQLSSSASSSSTISVTGWQDYLFNIWLF